MRTTVLFDTVTAFAFAAEKEPGESCELEIDTCSYGHVCSSTQGAEPTCLCPSALTLGNDCVKQLDSESRNYTDAKVACASAGGFLPVLDTAESLTLPLPEMRRKGMHCGSRGRGGRAGSIQWLPSLYQYKPSANSVSSSHSLLSHSMGRCRKAEGELQERSHWRHYDGQRDCDAQRHLPHGLRLCRFFLPLTLIEFLQPLTGSQTQLDRERLQCHGRQDCRSVTAFGSVIGAGDCKLSSSLAHSGSTYTEDPDFIVFSF